MTNQNENMTTTRETKKESESGFFTRGEQREQYPLYADEHVAITPDKLGQKVEFKSYENGRRVSGIGTLVGIDYKLHMVHVKMSNPIIISSKFGSYQTDTIQIGSSYQFERPSGCYIHRQQTCWRSDYPEDASIIFRFVNEGGDA
jgi:hypothetical protein